MNKYELVVIVDAALSQEQKEEVMREVSDVIAKQEGKLINRQTWLDKQRMNFRIKGKSEGTYYLINFESAPSATVHIRTALQMNEKILRFLLVRPE